MITSKKPLGKKEVAVAAGILTESRKVFLARRKTGLMFAGKWEFPGGKMKPNESPETCLVREFREEFEIKIQVMSFFAESRYVYPDAAVHLNAYFINLIEGQFCLHDHDKIAWVLPTNLINFDLLHPDIAIAKKLNDIHLSKAAPFATNGNEIVKQ